MLWGEKVTVFLTGTWLLDSFVLLELFTLEVISEVVIVVIKVDFLRVDRTFCLREMWTATGTLFLASNRPQVCINLFHLLFIVELLIRHLRLLGGVLIPEISQNRMLLAHLLGNDELLYFGNNRGAYPMLWHVLRGLALQYRESRILFGWVVTVSLSGLGFLMLGAVAVWPHSQAALNEDGFVAVTFAQLLNF